MKTILSVNNIEHTELVSPSSANGADAISSGVSVPSDVTDDEVELLMNLLLWGNILLLQKLSYFVRTNLIKSNFSVYILQRKPTRYLIWVDGWNLNLQKLFHFPMMHSSSHC